ILLNFSLLLLLAFSLLFPSCSEDLSENTPVSAGRLLRISVDDGGYTSGNGEEGDVPQTRAKEENYKTVFTVGDKIGVFAVKDGEIVEGGNNICFTALLSSSGDLDWEQLSESNLEIESATYYAYYPWQETLSGTLVPDAGDDAGFFANVISAWEPKADQSVYSDYTASDLMTAKGTSGSSTSISFSMTHRMGLVEFHLPKTVYTLTDKDSNPLPDYTVVASTDFTTNIPYFSGNTYRYLVKPERDTEVEGTYTSGEMNGNKWKFSTSAPAGNILLVHVDEAAETTKIHQLKIGDWFMKDGSLMAKGEINPDPSDILGIVFWVGDPTDETFGDPTLKREKPNCNHGLVVTIQKGLSSKWQAVADANINSPGYLPIATSPDLDNFNKILGYNNTMSIRTHNKNNPHTEVMTQKLIDELALTNHAPVSTSGWYHASLKELSTLCAGWSNNVSVVKGNEIKTLVNDQVRSLGWSYANNTIGPVNMWSSTDNIKGNPFIMTFSEAEISLSGRRTDFNAGLRPILAF
ncbi:MAG: fimbrillin family protein, partial [Parabacteroides gordonii]|nr:fimbrillin family protein [Parabacteroides gordonii]